MNEISDLTGKTVSYYKIQKLAGSGGMGRVFQARDRRLGRSVAIKILHADKAQDPRPRKRLLREARIYSALNHPGVVAVYDVGSDQGLDYIAMEWVSGRPLAEVLREGPLPIVQVLEIAAQLAGALVAVHGAGIVHRDLKPQNVMIGDDGTAKLLDFGVAKVDWTLDITTVNSESASSDEKTFPGTVAYMSPEQVLGEFLDHRSDIFSFGVVLFEMLTGSRPFQGKTPAAFVHRLLSDEAESPRKRRPEVPERLASLVLKALEKKPADRFQDMESLSHAIRPLLDGESKDQSRSPLRNFSKDRETYFALRPQVIALLISLLVVAGIAVNANMPVRWEDLVGIPPRDSAVSELPQTPYQLYEEGLRFLDRYDREGYTEAAIDRFEKSIAQSANFAPAHVGLSQGYWRQYLLKHDKAWLRKAEVSARRALELDPLLSDAAVAMALVRYAERSFDEAKLQLETVLMVNPDSENAIASLAEIAAAERNFEESIKLYNQSIELNPQNWRLHAELGRVHVNSGNLAAAEAAFRSSLEIAPDNALARRNLGAILHYLSRYSEAVTELQHSITIRPTDRAYTNLGTAYFFQGHYRQAATAFRAARDMRPNVYTNWSNLGDAYRQLPETQKEAIACFNRAIQLLRVHMTADPPEPHLQSQLALFRAKVGRRKEALAAISLVGPLASLPSRIAFRATLVYELAGEREKALAALEVALEGDFPLVEIANEPDLTDMREDVAFHHLMIDHESSTDH